MNIHHVNMLLGFKKLMIETFATLIRSLFIVCLFMYLFYKFWLKLAPKRDLLYINEMIKINFTVARIVLQHKTKVVCHNQLVYRLVFAHLEGWEPNKFQFYKQINDGD